MATGGRKAQGRLVLDANPLITVDREKHRVLRRLLGQAAQDGRVVVPSLVIKRMEMYKGKRKWAAAFVQRYKGNIETTFHLNDEFILFATKKRLHPELADDDVQALVIAKVRQWTLVTHETPMLNAAEQQQVHTINNLEDLQRVLEGRLL